MILVLKIKTRVINKTENSQHALISGSTRKVVDIEKLLRRTQSFLNILSLENTKSSQSFVDFDCVNTT